jgi:uncharacterized protein YbjT (DUF2867 family)
MLSQIRSSHVSVIVTGASGQLGRLVIDHLLATLPAGRPTTPVADAIAAALAG